MSISSGDLVARLPARLRPLVAELSKFVVVGSLCFVLDTLLAYFFYRSAHLGPTTSKALSTVIATGTSYLGNRLWSFSHRVDSDNPSHGRDLVRYCLIAAAGLLITLVPVDLVHYGLGRKSALAFNLSGIAGTAVATVFRFWAYRRWVFAHAAPVVSLVGDGAPEAAAVEGPATQGAATQGPATQAAGPSREDDAVAS